MSDPVNDLDRAFPPIDPVPVTADPPSAPAQEGPDLIQSIKNVRSGSDPAEAEATPAVDQPPDTTDTADTLLEVPLAAAMAMEGDSEWRPDSTGEPKDIFEQEGNVVDVAVVFIHGMGEQKPGGMLAEYMNPSLEWIKRVTSDDHHTYHANNFDENLLEGVNILERNRGIRRDGSGMPIPEQDSWIDIETIQHGLLQSASSTPDTFQPPYIDVVLKEGNYDPSSSSEPNVEATKRLVAVEAWWTKEFEPPPFKEVAAWGLGVAPSIILRHIALLWEQDSGNDATHVAPGADQFVPDTLSQKIARIVHALVATVYIGLIAVLIQWLICLLMLLAPIPFLQKYIRAIVLKLSTSLGDVLVYAHDGVKSAAIRTTVLRAVLWLHNRYKVKNLIVVAHSLGSVIACDILSTRRVSMTADGSAEVRNVTLVTFGSPLKKVNVILDLKRDEQRVSLGMLFATLSTFSAVMAVVSYTNPEWFWHWQKQGFSDLWTMSVHVQRWVVALTISLGMYLLGIGAHAKPGLLGLSIWEKLGLLCAIIACGIGAFVASGWWSLACIAALGMVLLSARLAAETRRSFVHRPDRMSLALAIGGASIGLMLVLTAIRFIPTSVFFLVIAAAFAVMSASNPLEEFSWSESGDYVRRKPGFSFSTPISRWIDFWATKDLVPEFGLHRVKFTSPRSATPQEPTSRRVTNQSSYFSDHTTYKSNTEQFVAPLSRLFLEELGYTSLPDSAPSDQHPFLTFLGITKWKHIDEYPEEVRQNPGAARQRLYAENIANVARSRTPRFQMLSWFSTLLLAMFILLSPGIGRSIGEFIVFSSPDTSSEEMATSDTQEAVDTNAMAATGTGAKTIVACGEGESAGENEVCAPKWFTAFYNAEPRTCDESCPVRVPPLVPADLVNRVMSNEVTRSVVVYGLGYLILVALASLLRIALLVTPWRSWELALLDRVAQQGAVVRTSALIPWRGWWLRWDRLGVNAVIRGLVFTGAGVSVLFFLVALHTGFLWMQFMSEAHLAPWWTLQSLWQNLREFVQNRGASDAAISLGKTLIDLLSGVVHP